MSGLLTAVVVGSGCVDDGSEIDTTRGWAITEFEDAVGRAMLNEDGTIIHADLQNIDGTETYLLLEWNLEEAAIRLTDPRNHMSLALPSDDPSLAETATPERATHIAYERWKAGETPYHHDDCCCGYTKSCFTTVVCHHDYVPGGVYCTHEGCYTLPGTWELHCIPYTECMDFCSCFKSECD